jgi:hypothetical protein
MANKIPPRSGQKAFVIWLQLIGLLGGLLVFGLAVYELRRSL